MLGSMCSSGIVLHTLCCMRLGPRHAVLRDASVNINVNFGGRRILEHCAAARLQPRLAWKLLKGAGNF